MQNILPLYIFGHSPWLGVRWSWTEVVWLISPPQQDRIVLMSPLLQRTPLSSSQRSRWSTPSTGGRVGRTWPCFFKALASEGVAVLMEDFTFIAGEEDTRVLVEGLVVLKGDLTTVSTEVVVEKLSARLEGEKEGAPVQFPPDRRPAKPLADASCCASMQRSAQRIDLVKLLLGFHFFKE